MKEVRIIMWGIILVLGIATILLIKENRIITKVNMELNAEVAEERAAVYVYQDVYEECMFQSGAYNINY